MRFRIAMTIALLLVLSGCAPDPPRADRMQTVLQNHAQDTIRQEREQMASTRVGQLAMQFADTPSPDDAKVRNVQVLETEEAAEDNSIYVTVAYDVVIGGNTFHVTKIVLMDRQDDKWMLRKVL